MSYVLTEVSQRRWRWFPQTRLHVTRRTSCSFNVDTELIASTQHEGVLQHETDSVLQTEVCSEIERRVILLSLTHHIWRVQINVFKT